MQIKYLGEDKYEIKNKDVLIELSNKLSVNGFVFPGAGEYEKSGVIINGIADGETNTVYTMVFEEINICYLDHISHDLNEEEIKQIGNVDILFLPLGAENTLEVKTALKLLTKIDPRIVIPIYYRDLIDFSKSEGPYEETDLLKIKKAELPTDERKTIVLSPNSSR